MQATNNIGLRLPIGGLNLIRRIVQNILPDCIDIELIPVPADGTCGLVSIQRAIEGLDFGRNSPANRNRLVAERSPETVRWSEEFGLPYGASFYQMQSLCESLDAQQLINIYPDVNLFIIDMENNQITFQERGELAPLVILVRSNSATELIETNNIHEEGRQGHYNLVGVITQDGLRTQQPSNQYQDILNRMWGSLDLNDDYIQYCFGTRSVIPTDLAINIFLEATDPPPYLPSQNPNFTKYLNKFKSNPKLKSKKNNNKSGGKRTINKIKKKRK